VGGSCDDGAWGPYDAETSTRGDAAQGSWADMDRLGMVFCCVRGRDGRLIPEAAQVTGACAYRQISGVVHRVGQMVRLW
jgi:hypothetical protein